MIVRARVALAGIGLLLGLWGIRWGLPDQTRLQRVLAPQLDTPLLRRRLVDSWTARHQFLGPNLMNNPAAGIVFSGVERVPAGWQDPPEILLSSLRSFSTRSANEDEQSILLALSRMHPSRLDFNPHLFTYGGTYIYAVGLWEAVGYALQAVPLHHSLEPYLEDPSQMASVYYWGRLLSVAAYIGCALLLLEIGRRSSYPEAGALAALMFLLCPLAIAQAHVLKVHIVWSFLALATLTCCQYVLERGAPFDYAAAGAAAGLTCGTFLLGWPAVVVVGLAIWFRWGYGRSSVSQAWRGTALAATAAVAAFFLTNPYWILSLREALQEMHALTGSIPFAWDRPLIFLGVAMRRSITTPMLGLVLIGVVRALVRGRRDPQLMLIVASFAAGLLFTWTAGAATTAGAARYGLGWTGVGLFLAAWAVVDWVKSSRAVARAIVVGAAAAIVLNLGVYGMTYAYNFHLDSGDRSNHVQSGEWIEAHVPAGSSIGMLRLPQPSNAPYFRYQRYKLVFIEPRLFAGLAPGALPGYLALTMPDYDDRPGLGANLSRYDRVAVFDRGRIFSWAEVDPGATTANPMIEIYRLKS